LVPMAKDKVFCESCQKDAFVFGPQTTDDQVILTCKGCGRPYILQGEAWIGDPSGGPKAKHPIKWDWSKSRWVPM